MYQVRKLPKNGYGQLKQKVISSKRRGAGADKVFQPQWPFYDNMDSFVKDFLSPRSTESNLEKLSRTDIPSQKACTKKESTTVEEDDIQLRRQVKALNKLDDLNGNK